MANAKDFNNYLLQAENEYLKKQISKYESGEIYVGLIGIIADLRAENSELREKAERYDAIRRFIE